MAKQITREDTAPYDNDTPVYSGRIIRIYLDYLRHHYPAIKPSEILEPAGIKAAEINDPGFWYSQNQAECMQQVMVAKTGAPHFARAAGRYTARSKTLGRVRQFVLALLSPSYVYMRIEKLYSLMSRGARIKVETLRPFKIKVTATPMPGIDEKSFQCENRMGTFEGMVSLFSGKNARVTHTECLHAGGRACEYIITWEPTLALSLKSVKHWVTAGAVLTTAGLYFYLSFKTWLTSAMALTGLAMAFALISDHFEKKELAAVLAEHFRRIKKPLQDSDQRYNNARLIQELGQATARVFDIDKYLRTVMDTMRKRLGFDRGAILMADGTGKHLRLAAGFGYTCAEEDLISHAADHLDTPQYRLFTEDLLNQGKSILVNDLPEQAARLSSRGNAFAAKMRTHSFICVPVSFEDQPLGLLLMDNLTPKRRYYQSDVNFLEGIAGQIATSIINAKSFTRLQESEEKFRLAFQTGPDAFTMNRYDDGTYVDANEGFLDITGYSREEVIGRTPAELGIWESSAARRRVAVEIGRQGAIDRFETRFRLKNGRMVNGQVSAKIVMIDQQKHVLSITRDITDIKRMEAERNRLETRLRQSAKMESLGTLAGGIAHDFNNLMMGIQGNIDLMALDTEPTDGNFSRLKTIEQHVESASRLTRQLLGFAQVGKYDVRPTDLNDLAKRTVRMFARTRKELSVNLKPAGNIWTVEADQGQIEQVLLNLLVNAWQAMPDGGDVIIEVSNAILDNEKARLLGIKLGPHVQVTVTDTGVGMDTATQEKIFDPFFTTRKMGRGTGLGLASAYGIVKNHGGTIEVSSRKGSGSAFSIYLPASGKPVHKKAEQPPHLETGTGTILLVDDEEMILEVGQQLLEHLGYSVRTAGNGQDAVALVLEGQKKIDLIILDLIMPEMGGGETFDAIREANPQMKVLLSSGYALEGEAAEILDRGCNGFIQKPFSLNDLSDKIKTILVTGGR